MNNPSESALTIVSAYQGMMSYVRAAKATARPDLAALWVQHVVDPYWSDWAAGQFNEARTRQQLSQPISRLDDLAADVELLAVSGVEQIVEEAYGRITAALPSPLPRRAVCLYAADPASESHKALAVVGTGVGDNILLRIAPGAADWKAWVPYVMAHEYHHAVWGYNYFAVQGHTHMDLLTGLIIDGEADSFARVLYPETLPAWIDALTPVQEAVQWERMQEYLAGNDDAIYRRFFFGEPGSDTPPYSAYTIGYHMVQAYLARHPGVTVLELMNLDAPTILAGSGYPAWLQSAGSSLGRVTAAQRSV